MSVFASENISNGNITTINNVDNENSSNVENSNSEANESTAVVENLATDEKEPKADEADHKTSDSDSVITDIKEAESDVESSVENITIIDALEDFKENGVEAISDTKDNESKKLDKKKKTIGDNAEYAIENIEEVLEDDVEADPADEDTNEYIAEEDEVDFDVDNDNSDEKSSTPKKKGKRNYNVKLSGDVRARIVQYANSLGGFFESPYVRGGMTLAWQCCAYVNQVWWDVFGVDLYSISESAKNTFSEDGESAYEFFERVGVKSGDVIYTRYQKIKKNKRGGVLRDKNGDPVKTMGQHFVVVLDYDEEYIWYTDGYESRTRGFVVSSIDKKIKYSDSKYFRNVGGAYSDIDGAYYAKAGKRGTRFRYYRLPEYVWNRAGGDTTGKYDVSGENNRLRSMAVLSATESTEVLGGAGDLWIAGLDNDGYEYNGGEITPDVEVYDNFKLIDKEEYVVEYTNNVDAGEATVWVSKITEPIYTISANFIIRPYDLAAHYNSENPEESDIIVKMPEVVKTGAFESIKPLVTCTVSVNSISENNISENSISENDIDEDNSNSSEDIIDEENTGEVGAVDGDISEDITGEDSSGDAEIVEDEVIYNKIRLVNNKSCEFTYIYEGSDTELDNDLDSANANNEKLTVLIEGIGNFTGSIYVETDVKAVSKPKSMAEREEQIKKNRADSRKREIRNRLRNR